MPEDPTSDASGPMESVRRVLESFLSLLSDRWQLFVVEAQEEKYRLLGLLLLVGFAVSTFLMALMIATFTVIVLLWNTPARPWIMVGFTVLYTGGCTWALLRIKHRLRTGPRPFEATTEEFKKDRQWFSRKN